jgi:Fe-S cluster assembly iron-binding protein IscA
MITVTDKAIDALAESLESSEASDEQRLRLARNPGGEFGLAIDEERDGDQVVKHNDRTVLVIDETVATSLDGATLDVVDLPEGQRLTLRMDDKS